MLQIFNNNYFSARVFRSVMFYTLLSVASVSAQNKYVIGCWKSGFFSMFLGVLNHLHWCDEHNATPVVYWDGGCFFSHPTIGHRNAWKNYFKPVSKLKYVVGDRIHNHYVSDDYQAGTSWIFMAGENDELHRKVANKLINKYIKIQPDLLKKIDDFYNSCMKGKRTIGIHLRGTDKPLEGETPVVPLVEIIDEAKKYADNDTQFFIATEDIRLFNEAQQMLRGRTVLYQNSIRVSSDAWMWFVGQPNRVQLGMDVIMDMVLLSRCDLLIHTTSNVSTAALFFNPDLVSVHKKGQRKSL